MAHGPSGQWDVFLTPFLATAVSIHLLEDHKLYLNHMFDPVCKFYSNHQLDF